jgi:hypothetical protein
MDWRDKRPDGSSQPASVTDEGTHPDAAPGNPDLLVGRHEPRIDLKGDDTGSNISDSPTGHVVRSHSRTQMQPQDEPPTEHDKPPNRGGSALKHRSRPLFGRAVIPLRDRHLESACIVGPSEPIWVFGRLTAMSTSGHSESLAEEVAPIPVRRTGATLRHLGDTNRPLRPGDPC